MHFSRGDAMEMTGSCAVWRSSFALFSSSSLRSMMFFPLTTRSSAPVIPISFITGIASDNVGENSSVMAAMGIRGSMGIRFYTKSMFFRRSRPKVPTFQERVSMLTNAGFITQTMADGRVRVAKGGVAAMIGDEGKGQAEIEKAGIVYGNEIATLLNGGYQMFL